MRRHQLGLVADILLALLVLLAALFCVRLTVGLPWETVETHLDRWASPTVPAVAALLIAVRALLLRSISVGWLLIAIGQACWAFGAFWYAVVLWTADPMPFPSPADAGWLVFYVPTFAGIVLLAREQVRDRSAVSVLDGLIGALAITSIGAALAFGAIVDATGGSPLAIATNLAYPLGDLALIAAVVGAIAVSGWRLSRRWIALSLGLVVFGVTDTLYLFRIAEGTYEVGTLLDAGWVVASTVTAVAAWAPATRARAQIRGWSAFVFPAVFGLCALGTLVYDHFRPVHLLALALSAGCVTAVILRMMLIFRENLAVLQTSRNEASTDALTALGNRRKLLHDLDRAERGSLVLFDLDGFKGYNDTYGHLAGDALLARLGRRLAAVAGDSALAYRLGGDEFCVLTMDGCNPAERALELAGALSEQGDGFSVTSSYGVVSFPAEARTASDILRVADQRMYAQKQGRETSAGRQSRNVLLRALSERSPELIDHVADVAELAEEVARLLDLPGHEVEQIRQAAELHDVGKVAVPDEILEKRGPLDEEEWEFIHQHTVIGERIISAAPALAHVAKLVRSSHERWDGTGYPDQLAGKAIPWGSRIVGACDALAAMVSERPYRSAVDLPEALAELDRCSGSQFDPAVVAALTTVLTAPLAASTAAA